VVGGLGLGGGGGGEGGGGGGWVGGKKKMEAAPLCKIARVASGRLRKNFLGSLEKRKRGAGRGA